MSNQIHLYFMNKAFSIQRSKIISAYGGVGTNIDTIDNISLLIRPFDEWNIYEKVLLPNQHKDVKRLLFKEDRLCARLRSIGFKKIKSFFLLEDFSNESPVKPWSPKDNEKGRMVTSLFFPRWFYCPKCHHFKPVEEWRSEWSLDSNWDKHVPACAHCSRKSGRGYYRSPLQQIRFVMASMETGEIVDIPWNKIFSKKGASDKKTASVWYIDSSTPESQNVKFTMSKGSADLYGISVSNERGIKVTMAELMTRYIVMPDENGHEVVYHPVIRNSNNVYFGYNISSVFIPRKEIPQSVIAQIKNFFEHNIRDIGLIKSLGNIELTEEEINGIIESNFTPQQPLEYTNEDEFRKDEFDFITDDSIYKDGVYMNDEGRLISEVYNWDDKPPFISKILFQRKLNVTSVQVAYSRIDRISPSSLPQWSGRSDMPKQWYNPHTCVLDRNIEVKLHPTCKDKIENIKLMPAVSSYGEGFFLQLDLDSIPKNDRYTFMHTFCHLIMKELEFSCGYPLASMNERLYYLPKQETDHSPSARDRFGFLIYSANGEAGSYGGITSLFYSDKFKNIINQALLLAQDCPNDPICEEDKGHCFACVELPETSCENFNQKLNRLVVRNYLCDKVCVSETVSRAMDNQAQSLMSSIINNSSQEDDDILD